jgi:hypothetical protein
MLEILYVWMFIPQIFGGETLNLKEGFETTSIHHQPCGSNSPFHCLTMLRREFVSPYVGKK